MRRIALITTFFVLLLLVSSMSSSQGSLTQNASASRVIYANLRPADEQAVSAQTVVEGDYEFLQVPLITQSEYGCGAASLAMVLGYYGEKNDQKFYENCVGSGTTTADQIMACAESLGYSAQLVSSPVEDLAKDIENGMPVIVAYNPGQYHWSVFAGYDDGFVVLANPWGYYDTVPAGEFSSMFSQTGNLGIKIWKE